MPERASVGTLPAATPGVRETVALLRSVRGLADADAVTLTCTVARGESVHLAECDDGGLLVSDQGETARYLGDGDPEHRALDLPELERLCRQAGAAILDMPERWPRIVAPGAPTVAEAVRIVGDAIDRCFTAATVVPS